MPFFKNKANAQKSSRYLEEPKGLDAHILFHIGGLEHIPLRFNFLEIPSGDLYEVILPTPCFPAKSGYFKADNFNEFIFLSEL